MSLLDRFVEKKTTDENPLVSEVAMFELAQKPADSATKLQ